MMVQRKILVTGLSGVVGSAIRPALEKRYQVASDAASAITGAFLRIDAGRM